MQQEVNKRKESNDNNSKSDDNKTGIPTEIVTKTEMEHRTDNKMTHQKPLNDTMKTVSKHISKMEPKEGDIPVGSNTKKDTEPCIQQTESKTTDATSTDIINPKHPIHAEEGQDQQNTNNPDTKLAISVNRKTYIESAASKTNQDGIIQDKQKTVTGINDIERMTSDSTPTSSDTTRPKDVKYNITKQRDGTSNGTINETPASVKILIMNADGDGDKGDSPAKRRRKAIHDVVEKHKPIIVLFQEFPMKDIRGKKWDNCNLPDQFAYKGHKEASIMYDETCIKVKGLPATDIDTIVSELQRKTTVPMDFNPVARMGIYRITAKIKSGDLDFICISWHAKSNKNGGRGAMTVEAKIEYFKNWMKFLINVRQKYHLPILVGGDYNVDMSKIEDHVPCSFKLCKYKASERRTKAGIIDYCITTDDIKFSDITWVNLEADTTVPNPNGILNHDPIVGFLTLSAFGEPEAAIGIAGTATLNKSNEGTVEE